MNIFVYYQTYCKIYIFGTDSNVFSKIIIIPTNIIRSCRNYLFYYIISNIMLYYCILAKCCHPSWFSCARFLTILCAIGGFLLVGNSTWSTCSRTLRAITSEDLFLRFIFFFSSALDMSFQSFLKQLLFESKEIQVLPEPSPPPLHHPLSLPYYVLFRGPCPCQYHAPSKKEGSQNGLLWKDSLLVIILRYC